MNQKLSIQICIAFLIAYNLGLSSCALAPSVDPSLVPTFTQTPAPTSTNLALATADVTATPVGDSRTIILTPDDLFLLPGLKGWSTPDSGDFCEQLPPPQIVAHSDRFSALSGKFVLCIYERSNTAIDLDTGSFVSTDDDTGDIVMQSSRSWSAEKPGYVIAGWNNAFLNSAYVLEKYANHPGANHLSYEYCEKMVRDQADRGATGVEVDEIACVRTTESKIALIRVESIYPAATLSVEFSFAVLRSE